MEEALSFFVSSVKFTSKTRRGQEKCQQDRGRIRPKKKIGGEESIENRKKKRFGIKPINKVKSNCCVLIRSLTAINQSVKSSMAATVSLSFSLDPQHHHLFSNTTHFKPHQTPLLPLSAPTSTLFPKYPLAIFHKSHPSSFKSSSSPSHSSTTTTTASDTTATDTATTTSTSTTSSSFLEYPLRTGRFLSSEELEQLKLLENFRYYQELESGAMWVRVMRPEEMDITVGVLAESFAESMLLPSGYVSVLGYLVKQYLFERMELSPHTATLIGFYRRRKEEGEEQQEKNTEDEEEVDEVEFLAGTVEVCFDKKGANASPPTPTPPKNSPYISNMAVKKSLRRFVLLFQLRLFLLRTTNAFISLSTVCSAYILVC